MSPDSRPTTHDPRVRLSKFLARAGVTSRRGAAGLVASGRVRINGKPPLGPGDPVDPLRDTVTLDGRALKPAAPAWIVLHKPTGYVTSRARTERFPAVFELIARADDALVAVGRLDVMSEGVLLFTTDGELAARLMHPRHRVPRRYAVGVTGRLGAEKLRGLEQGITLDDGVVRPTRVKFTPDKTGGLLELELAEGRNRVVRRLCEALGLTVRRLVRTAYGPVKLADLKAGVSRPLTQKEVESLYHSVGLSHSS